MNKLNQKGVVHLIIPLVLLLLAGIVVGVYLITNGNPLKLFSRATTPPIVFKATDGSALPKTQSDVPVSSSPNVRVELTSPLGPPAGGPSAPVSAPNQRRTVSYKIAEDAANLNSATSYSYNAEPTSLLYTFAVSLQPCTSEQKFLWVEFRANDGSIDRRTAQIQIEAFCPTPPPISGPVTPTPPPSVIPTATPTIEPTPTATPSNVGIGGPGGGGGSTPTQPTTKTISQVRVAENLANLSSALWKTYTQGMVLSHTFIDPSPGEKFIFVQFSDSQGQIIKINGLDYIQSSITLEEQPAISPPPQGGQEEVTVGTASLSTDSTVTQRDGNWGSDYINLTLSGFSTPGRSIAGLFVRNQTGECSISSCGYIGWTQIRSYGTNGTDTNPWTAPAGFSAGVHMFAVFALNADGTAGRLLDVSASNFSAPASNPTSSFSCQVNVTTCSCDNPDPSSSRYPGKCYPECNGGWCNGGICSTCQP